ncbi:hypothetical protein PFISCL1PPCAC_2223, partial [Pristionchus fissidentatus]
WLGLSEVNGKLFPSAAHLMIPIQVVKASYQKIEGADRYMWQILFKESNCPRDEQSPTKEKCKIIPDYPYGFNRFNVTLITYEGKSDEWSGERTLSDEMNRIWKDLEMINVAIPGSKNLFY